MSKAAQTAKNKNSKSKLGVSGTDTQNGTGLKTRFSLNFYFNIFSSKSPTAFAIEANPKSVG